MKSHVLTPQMSTGEAGRPVGHHCPTMIIIIIIIIVCVYIYIYSFWLKIVIVYIGLNITRQF